MSDEYIKKHGIPATLAEVEKLFQFCDAQQHFELVKRYIKPAINLTLQSTDDGEIPCGQSKTGGLPDLPAEMPWPRDEDGMPLHFLAQLNLAEVSPYDATGLLPPKGLLSFFYSVRRQPWESVSSDGWFTVLYRENPADCTRQRCPKDLELLRIFHPNTLAYESVLTVADCYDSSVSSLVKNMEACIKSEWGMDYQILGQPNCVQGNMEQQCDEAMGQSTRDTPFEERGGAYSDWVLLLQLDSSEETGMMWSDLGKLYFWIRKQDLQAKNFDNMCCILQCY